MVLSCRNILTDEYRTKRVMIDAAKMDVLWAKFEVFAPRWVSEPETMITEELFLNLVYCMQLR